MNRVVYDFAQWAASQVQFSYLLWERSIERWIVHYEFPYSTELQLTTSELYTIWWNLPEEDKTY